MGKRRSDMPAGALTLRTGLLGKGEGPIRPLSRSSTRTMIASLTAWASVSNSKQPCHVGYEQRVLLRSASLA